MPLIKILITASDKMSQIKQIRVHFIFRSIMPIFKHHISGLLAWFSHNSETNYDLVQKTESVDWCKLSWFLKSRTFKTIRRVKSTSGEDKKLGFDHISPTRPLHPSINILSYIYIPIKLLQSCQTHSNVVDTSNNLKQT